MFTRILLGVDGSDGALKAADEAAILAERFQASLTLVNVFQPIPAYGPFREVVNLDLEKQYIQETQEQAASQTRRAVEELCVPYQIRWEIGHPAAEIVRVAEEDGCDLIVLGSRGLSGIKALLLGSVADYVTHHAHCPILIVR